MANIYRAALLLFCSAQVWTAAAQPSGHLADDAVQNEEGLLQLVGQREQSERSACGSDASARLRDFELVRKDLLKLMTDPRCFNNLCAPLFIRLVFHQSATYKADDGTGGPNGATMRWPREMSDASNAGLELARDLLQPLKNKYCGMSYSDLWVLASYVALEVVGGPSIDFVWGREDGPEGCAIDHGRLPGPDGPPLVVGGGCNCGYGGCSCFPGVEVMPQDMNLDNEGKLVGWQRVLTGTRGAFRRMGFNDQEMVALLVGGHSVGRANRDNTGKHGSWTDTGSKFSNEYAALLLEREWVVVNDKTTTLPGNVPLPDAVKPGRGNRQFVDLTSIKEGGPMHIMLFSDMILRYDDALRQQLMLYANDVNLLRRDFAAAWKRLTELGTPWSQDSPKKAGQRCPAGRA